MRTDTAVLSSERAQLPLACSEQRMLFGNKTPPCWRKRQIGGAHLASRLLPLSCGPVTRRPRGCVRIGLQPGVGVRSLQELISARSRQQKVCTRCGTLELQTQADATGDVAKFCAARMCRVLLYGIQMPWYPARCALAHSVRAVLCVPRPACPDMSAGAAWQCPEANNGGGTPVGRPVQRSRSKSTAPSRQGFGNSTVCGRRRGDAVCACTKTGGQEWDRQTSRLCIQ